MLSGSYTTLSNSSNYIGGIAGIVSNVSEDIINCHVINTSFSTSANTTYFGGLFGALAAPCNISKCSAVDVEISHKYRYVGGLIGDVNLTGEATISDCYVKGGSINVGSTGSYSGGLIGYHENGTLTVNRCYASNTVNGGFAIGGFAGFVKLSSITINNCAAWNGSVTAASYGTKNWSSGAFTGVTHPNCHMTGNYRNPSMTLTAWWIPTADYSHPDIDGTTHPLVRISTDKSSYAETTLTTFNSTEGEANRWAYHGKVESGKTLSQLASTTLGWSSDVWDFSESLPTLK